MATELEGGEGSASRPGRSLPPGKTRYPLYRRLGGPQDRSGLVQKISPTTGTVQPVASHYTDWAIPAQWRRQVYKNTCGRSRYVLSRPQFVVMQIPGHGTTCAPNIRAELLNMEAVCSEMPLTRLTSVEFFTSDRIFFLWCILLQVTNSSYS